MPNWQYTLLARKFSGAFTRQEGPGGGWRMEEVARRISCIAGGAAGTPRSPPPLRWLCPDARSRVERDWRMGPGEQDVQSGFPG